MINYSSRFCVNLNKNMSPSAKLLVISLREGQIFAKISSRNNAWFIQVRVKIKKKTDEKRTKLCT